MPITRAKFVCLSIKKVNWNPEVAIVELGAVYSKIPGSENAGFTKATPSGRIEMQVDNPSAAVIFELGKEYYVDFTPAPMPEVKK